MGNEEDCLKSIKKLGTISGANHISDFWGGGSVSINKQSQLKMSVVFPGDQCLKNPQSVPLTTSDYKLIPLVIWIKPKK